MLSSANENDIILRDLTGREIHTGDVLAVGARSGNGGDLVIRVVAKIIDSKTWMGNPVKKVRTTSGGTLQDLTKVLIVPRDIFIGTNKEQWLQEQTSKILWN